MTYEEKLENVELLKELYLNKDTLDGGRKIVDNVVLEFLFHVIDQQAEDIKASKNKRSE